jgi:hypothetical protein
MYNPIFIQLFPILFSNNFINPYKKHVKNIDEKICVSCSLSRNPWKMGDVFRWTGNDETLKYINTRLILLKFRHTMYSVYTPIYRRCVN